jgi:hypothetical protein
VLLAAHIDLTKGYDQYLKRLMISAEECCLALLSKMSDFDSWKVKGKRPPWRVLARLPR